MTKEKKERKKRTGIDLILNIHDFDGNLTQGFSEGEFREENIKTGIKLTHSDKEILAIATYNSKPELVIKSLAFILGIKREEITVTSPTTDYFSEKNEMSLRVLACYLPTSRYPLLIACTYNELDYNEFHKHTRKIPFINAILKELRRICFAIDYEEIEIDGNNADDSCYVEKFLNALTKCTYTDDMEVILEDIRVEPILGKKIELFESLKEPNFWLIPYTPTETPVFTKDAAGNNVIIVDQSELFAEQKKRSGHA